MTRLINKGLGWINCLTGMLRLTGGDSHWSIARTGPKLLWSIAMARPEVSPRVRQAIPASHKATTVRHDRPLLPVACGLQLFWNRQFLRNRDVPKQLQTSGWLPPPRATSCHPKPPCVTSPPRVTELSPEFPYLVITTLSTKLLPPWLILST